MGSLHYGQDFICEFMKALEIQYKIMPWKLKWNFCLVVSLEV